MKAVKSFKDIPGLQPGEAILTYCTMLCKPDLNIKIETASGKGELIMATCNNDGCPLSVHRERSIPRIPVTPKEVGKLFELHKRIQKKA